jgi:peroxiredoxin
MGVRSRRYCLLVDDTVVKIANIEEGVGLENSTADKIMQDLEARKAS